MKPLSEQDHYETLEVPRDASSEEIERAYRIACGTYAVDSLAGYSVFEEGDCELLRERVEVAYRTLSDPQMRQSYDASLFAARDAQKPEPPGAGAAPAPASAAAASPVERALSAATAHHDGLEDFDDRAGEWDGARLRRARLEQGVEIEQIAEVTKVNPTYLAYIEEERFDGLPAAVYVRGFVMGYAGCLGIDPKTVAGSYMERFRQAPESARRRMFSRG